MMKKIKLLFCLLICFLQSCEAQTDKINGISYVASRNPINEGHVNPVVNINANYAAIMPFAHIRDLEYPEIVFHGKRQWFGETKAGVEQYIQQLRKHQIKIMLKPQIWVGRGVFTGFIEMHNEENWRILENTYTKFILNYAEVAEKLNLDMFCIGTELEKFIAHRPQYWNNLIVKIKAIYKGELTYAANWDEFKRTPFWDQLDYIGVDAYFPLSDSKTPTIAECLVGWKTHKQVVYNMHKKYKKPILFTEFGYRSVDYAGKEPWRSDRSMNQVNLQAQVNTTQALFETFWKEPWFKGGFVWKWFHNYEESGGENNSRFTPQNKPAETIIQENYKAYE